MPGVDGPHVHVVAVFRIRLPSLWCSVSVSIPGPTGPSPARPPGSASATAGPVEQLHELEVGASRSTRCSAVQLKLMTRTGAPGAVPPEATELLDQAALGEPAVPRGVLGLDRDLDPPVASRRPSRAACSG